MPKKDDDSKLGDDLPVAVSKAIVKSKFGPFVIAVLLLGNGVNGYMAHLRPEQPSFTSTDQERLEQCVSKATLEGFLTRVEFDLRMQVYHLRLQGADLGVAELKGALSNVNERLSQLLQTVTDVRVALGGLMRPSSQ